MGVATHGDGFELFPPEFSTLPNESDNLFVCLFSNSFYTLCKSLILVWVLSFCARIQKDDLVGCRNEKRRGPAYEKNEGNKEGRGNRMAYRERAEREKTNGSKNEGRKKGEKWAKEGKKRRDNRHTERQRLTELVEE